MKNRIITVLMLLILFSCTNNSKSYSKDYSATNKFEVDVKMLPSVELLSLIFNFVGNEEYNNKVIAEYDNELNANFSKYKNHKTIEYAKYLRANSYIGYNAPMDFALYLDNTMTSLISFDTIPKTMDSRWKQKDLIEFSNLVKQFSEETNFIEFYQIYEDKYRNSLEAVKAELDQKIDYNWFYSFYKNSNQPNFEIIASLQNAPSNYAVNTISNDKQTIYAVVGVREGKQGNLIINDNIIPIIIHEFCHSFSNPIVDNNYQLVEPIGSKMAIEYSSGKFSKAYYQNWETVLYESIVRASVACYLLSHDEEYNDKLDLQAGFPWTQALSENIMRNYVDNKAYNSFEEYLPEILKFFEEYLKE